MMTKLTRFILMFLFVEYARAETLLLDVVKDKKPGMEWTSFGQTCWYQTPEEEKKSHGSYTFISGTASEKSNDEWALINVQGRDVKIKRVKSENATISYVGNGIQLEVEFKVVKTCKRNTGCEGDTRDAILTVRTGGKMQKLRTVGYCAI